MQDRKPNKLERVDHEGYSVITVLSKDFGYQITEELTQNLAACKNALVPKVILDLSNCTTIGSEGIGLIVHNRKVYSPSFELSFVIAGDQFVDDLKACSVHGHLKSVLYRSLEQAEESVSGIRRTRPAKKRLGSRHCPKCESRDVSRYDSIIKRVIRFVKRKKPRFVCNRCGLVWR